jgi:hypothetical protein
LVILSVFSPEGVLHPVMEVLFGEARDFTARILLLFDWRGEEKWRSQALSMCKSLYVG